MITNFDIGSSDFGVDSTLVDGSIYLVEETSPDIPIFNPNPFFAVNVGGAERSKVAVMEDNTKVKLNGTLVATLNKSQTFAFTSNQFDILESDNLCL